MARLQALVQGVVTVCIVASYSCMHSRLGTRQRLTAMAAAVATLASAALADCMRQGTACRYETVLSQCAAFIQRARDPTSHSQAATEANGIVWIKFVR